MLALSFQGGTDTSLTQHLENLREQNAELSHEGGSARQNELARAAPTMHTALTASRRLADALVARGDQETMGQAMAVLDAVNAQLYGMLEGTGGGGGGNDRSDVQRSPPPSNANGRDAPREASLRGGEGSVQGSVRMGPGTGGESLGALSRVGSGGGSAGNLRMDVDARGGGPSDTSRGGSGGGGGGGPSRLFPIGEGTVGSAKVGPGQGNQGTGVGGSHLGGVSVGKPAGNPSPGRPPVGHPAPAVVVPARPPVKRFKFGL